MTSHVKKITFKNLRYNEACMFIVHAQMNQPCLQSFECQWGAGSLKHLMVNSSNCLSKIFILHAKTKSKYFYSCCHRMECQHHRGLKPHGCVEVWENPLNAESLTYFYYIQFENYRLLKITAILVMFRQPVSDYKWH